MFWESAAWHMAYNASVAALEDPNQPREALRRQGPARILETRRGLPRCAGSQQSQTAPSSTIARLALPGKFKDHCKAAEAYAEAAKRSRRDRRYARRFAAYELAQCPGHEREAYEKLRAFISKGEEEHLPTLLKWLGILQEKLNVPADQKVYSPCHRANP